MLFFSLKVPASKLMEVLTSKSTFARGEMIVSPLVSRQSVHVRDAFVKGIYGRTFEWIVNKINSAVYTPLVSRLFLTSIKIVYFTMAPIRCPFKCLKYFYTFH